MSDSDMDDNLLDQELIDDLQNADDLLGELQKEEAAPPARTSKSTVRWRKRDIDENVLYARPRSHRNQSEEVGHDQIPNPPCDTADHGTNSEVAFAPETASKTISAECLLQDLQHSLSVSQICSQCGNNCATVRCRDCLPCSFLCSECDISRHNKTYSLHNRDTMCAGFFQPLPPTSCVVDNAVTHCGHWKGHLWWGVVGSPRDFLQIQE
ncbi:uncharacterized protein LOC114567259 isoform X5 [Perca flavescens]|uniref:uncharacterized protein LOC114567259 isoform X5 n=1 Tax=Perca flavescens TaxID=8167 RepID=UPI00106E99F7|nr:uncharacterized protein LOC114567259 isoform X5 [Perca flavescens]